jgi:hypothetical protein
LPPLCWPSFMCRSCVKLHKYPKFFCSDEAWPFARGVTLYRTQGLVYCWKCLIGNGNFRVEHIHFLTFLSKFRNCSQSVHTRLLSGSVVVQALCYKPEGRGFDTRWGEFLNLANLSCSTRPWGLLSL